MIALRLVSPAKAQDSGRSVWDGVYTDAQAERGASAFGASCAACHGATLAGTGEAPSLASLEFVSHFDGATVGALFDRIRVTMPQNAAGSLSRNIYADITAFLLKSNGFPAGEKELDRRSEYLRGIAFTSAKPP